MIWRYNKTFRYSQEKIKNKWHLQIGLQKKNNVRTQTDLTNNVLNLFNKKIYLDCILYLRERDDMFRQLKDSKCEREGTLKSKVLSRSCWPRLKAVVGQTGKCHGRTQEPRHSTKKTWLSVRGR